MKKIITLLILTGLVSVSVMAEEVKLTKSIADWKFGTNVETRAGYNFDSKSPGLLGKTVVNVSATFYDQAATFEETDMTKKVRGKIVVTDLELKVATGDKSHDYAKTGVLNVNWESVIATVYFGPNLYIKMGDINSDQVRYVGSIADGDFSVIKYSILTPSFTGGRLGRTDYRTQVAGDYTASDKEAAETAGENARKAAYAAGKSAAYAEAEYETEYKKALEGKDKTASTYSTGDTSDRKTQTIENVSIAKDNIKTFVIGFEMPKMFKTEVGFAMRYNYLEKIDQPYNSYNINAMAEVYAMEEKFKFKVKADAVNGEVGEYTGTKADGTSSGSKIFNGGVTSNGNPLTVGGSISYTHALGKYNIIPAVGMEMQFEEKRKINSAANTFKFKRYTGDNTERMNLGAFSNKKADGGYFSKMTTPYEVGFGLSFNWKSLGETANKGFEGLAKGDVGTTDGISLSGFVGEAPYSPIPDISMKYYGVQLSFWDSEKDGKPGIIPGLAFGIIGNVNIAPEATLDLKEYANNGRLGSIVEYKTYELKLGNRIDAGVGVVLRTEKLLGMIQPYTGFVYKALDITGEREVLTTEIKDDDNGKKEYSAYVNDRYKTAATDTASELASRTDMRVKFGIDITLTPKVSINGEWASGNIVGSTLNENELNKAYDSYDYFENADKDGNPMLGSDARAGVVSVGLKVAF